MTSNPQILLNSISVEDFKVFLAEAVNDALGANTRANKDEEEVLTQNEAAKFLKCTVAHLITQRNKGSINCSFSGRKPLYKKSDLINYLSK